MSSKNIVSVNFEILTNPNTGEMNWVVVTPDDANGEVVTVSNGTMARSALTAATYVGFQRYGHLEPGLHIRDHERAGPYKR